MNRAKQIADNATVAQLREAHNAIHYLVMHKEDYILLEAIYILGVADGVRKERKKKSIANAGNIDNARM